MELVGDESLYHDQSQDRETFDLDQNHEVLSLNKDVSVFHDQLSDWEVEQTFESGSTILVENRDVSLFHDHSSNWEADGMHEISSSPITKVLKIDHAHQDVYLYMIQKVYIFITYH